MDCSIVVAGWLVAGLAVGFIAGVVFTIAMMVRSDKIAVKRGTVLIDGKFYRLNPLDIEEPKA